MRRIATVRARSTSLYEGGAVAQAWKTRIPYVPQGKVTLIFPRLRGQSDYAAIAAM
jgi:hypothetical protein